mmetsp:Transcript_13242/g.55499  ORF Transcript_13242/g.55499 Transcript_13242/m.55499 type:complete len:261 (-) Transcript_13242:1503-2285(-)
MARAELLHAAEVLGVVTVARGDHDDGQVLIHQRERPVLDLPRQHALRVHERDLLHLERSFHRGRVVIAPAEHEEALLLGELLGQLLHLGRELERLGDVLRQRRERVDDLDAPGQLCERVLRQRQRQHDQRDDLRRVRLGGSHADLRARVDVHAALRAHRDGRSHRVGDAHRERAARRRVIQRIERVLGLATLADKDASVVAHDGARAVGDVARELQRDGCAAELLEGGPRGQARVVRRSAAHEHQPVAAADDGKEIVHPA